MNEFILVDSIFFILQKRKQNSKVFGVLSEATSLMGFPGGSVGKESPCNAGDVGLIPGSGRSPGEGHGNPLQYSCLENSMDRGAWRATVHGVSKSWTRVKETNALLSLQPGPTLGCVCLLEALLAPERTEGSLCLAFTAAQLYQHHPPAARAGHGPGD